MNRVFQNSDIEVRWCGGGLFVRAQASSILLDCPIGVEHYLGERAGELDAVLLTSGRLQAVGGLIGLLESVNRYKRGGGGLTIHTCVGEERGPALVACWTRDWSTDLEVRLDVSVPGLDICSGAFDIRTECLPHGEPAWFQNRVVPAMGIGIRLTTGTTTLAWVPGAGPHPMVSRLCRGSSLAVIEVAGLAWPAGSGSWRLSVDQAREAGAEAAALWLVNDAGERVGAARA